MSEKPDIKKLTLAADSIFNKYDVNKRGFLGKNEVSQLIKDVYAGVGRSTPVTDLEISQFMTFMDRDGDGKINKK